MIVALLQEQEATSLTRLHEIVEPEAIAFWPPAPGWYVVFAALVALALVAAWNARQRYLRNAYRRAALEELAHLGPHPGAALPALLKRTALAGFPRAQVASLSGEAWLRFLDRTGQTQRFTDDVGPDLLGLAYGAQAPPAERIVRLRAAAEAWIRSHSTDLGGDAPC